MAGVNKMSPSLPGPSPTCLPYAPGDHKPIAWACMSCSSQCPMKWKKK